jgi:hypothetical protein
MPTHITTTTPGYVDLTDAGENTTHTHPAAATDASIVTYTPAVLTDWNGSADPGDVDNALDQLASRVKAVEGAGGGPAFAVGSVFIGVVSTNPATLLGYGTWSAIGAGRVLVGLDSGDTDFDTVEETGGAKTKALSAHANAAVTDHAAHTHAYTQTVNHVHVQNLPTPATGNFASGTRDTSSGGTGGTPGTVADAVSTANPTGGVASGTTGNPSATLTHSVTQPDAHTDLNVVQPYFVVYMWKRTA